ncbi:hypothetical protein ACIQ9P_24665 [Kitasatospora sp. NPDC094019]|uniref:DUF7919 family protein n=1 Tax=Kitasatospora sp. NPDC094019 TaxID=3364091 RepID=UPI00380987E6
MEYLDGSPYEYRSFPLPMISIGWLGRAQGLQSEGSEPLAAAEFDVLKRLSVRPGSVTLGVHECELCPEGEEFEGNGEYRYYFDDGNVYSAPVMILHYVEDHGYSPPRPFVDCLRRSTPLRWDWRAERLADLLLDESADFDFRCEAVIDLPKWRDSRVVSAVKAAGLDEILADSAGDEIGRSLGILARSGLMEPADLEGYSDFVQFGIREVLGG